MNSLPPAAPALHLSIDYLRRLGTATLLAVGLAVLSLVLFGKMPGDGRWVADLSNAAHGPAFAIVALVLWTLLRSRMGVRLSIFREYLLAVSITVLLGAFVELLQLLIGRDASFSDLWHDLLGALAAVGSLLVFDSRVRTSPARRLLRSTGILIASISVVLMLAPLGVSAAAYLQRHLGFPTLVDFSSPLSTYFLRTHPSVTIERSSLPLGLRLDTGSSVGLRVRLADIDEWWGLLLQEPVRDWRGYRCVNLDVANPTDLPLVLQLQIRDRRHRQNQRSGYRGSVKLAPNARGVLSVALSELTTGEEAVRVDIAEIAFVMIARSRANRAREFYVMRIWLD